MKIDVITEINISCHRDMIPDNTTRSLRFKPRRSNPCFKVLMFALGGIKLDKASFKSDSLPSLRPISTSQDGPII